MRKTVGHIGCWEEILEKFIMFQSPLDIFTAVSSVHLLRPLVRALPFLASPEADTENSGEERMDAQEEVQKPEATGRHQESFCVDVSYA